MGFRPRSAWKAYYSLGLLDVAQGRACRRLGSTLKRDPRFEIPGIAYEVIDGGSSGRPNIIQFEAADPLGRKFLALPSPIIRVMSSVGKYRLQVLRLYKEVSETSPSCAGVFHTADQITTQLYRLGQDHPDPS